MLVAQIRGNRLTGTAEITNLKLTDRAGTLGLPQDALDNLGNLGKELIQKVYRLSYLERHLEKNSGTIFGTVIVTEKQLGRHKETINFLLSGMKNPKSERRLVD